MAKKQLLVVGGLLILTGYFIYTYRMAFAVGFFGARVFLGMPVDSSDSDKVGNAGLIGFATILAGLAVEIIGFLKDSKSRPSQKAADQKFCTQCGARNIVADVFCKECGAKFT